MGLTINWTIEYKGNKEQLVKKLQQIRSKCLDLPFEQVREVKVAKITKDTWTTYNRLQQECSYPNNTDENLERRDGILEQNFGITTWEMIEADHYWSGKKMIECSGKQTTLVGLYLHPGKGCEDSSLNFYKRGNKYVCQSFCKTQYAEHFVRCHLLVIQLLDMLKQEGFEVNVSDAGEYWETRDLKVLGKNINESTAMLKSVFGGLQTAAKKNGMVLEASITECENYMKVDE